MKHYVGIKSYNWLDHFLILVIIVMLRVIFSAPFWGRIRTPLTDSLRKHGKSIFLCLKTNLPPRNYFKKYESWDLHFLWRYKAGHLDISVSEQTFDRACRKMSFWLTSRPVQSSWVTSESFSSVFQNEHFHPWMEYWYLSILKS